jgi:hypothetical protein
MFIVFVIVMIVIVGVVSIGRAFFNNSQQETTITEETDKGRTELLKTSDGHGVQMTVRGPLVADENFKSYSILVSPDERSMSVYEGYQDKLKKRKVLSNNDKAYEQFVHALDKANLMKGEVPTDDEKNDLRGICATGYVYEYSVVVNGDTIKRLWTSTCGGSPGSLEASTDQLNSLFFTQVPGSTELIPFGRSRFNFSL